MYDVTYHEGKFLITTNKDDCRNFKVMYCELENTEMDYVVIEDYLFEKQ